MYAVVYYSTGGTRRTRYFETLQEATLFCIYKVPYSSVDGVDKIDK